MDFITWSHHSVECYRSLMGNHEPDSQNILKNKILLSNLTINKEYYFVFPKIFVSFFKNIKLLEMHGWNVLLMTWLNDWMRMFSLLFSVFLNILYWKLPQCQVLCSQRQSLFLHWFILIWLGLKPCTAYTLAWESKHLKAVTPLEIKCSWQRGN